MARTCKGGLSQHPTKGYRLTIGKKADGKPRLFWLGHDRFFAEYHAGLLRDRFDLMKAHGRDVWTSDDVQAVLELVNTFKATMAALRNRRALDLKELDQQ